MENTSSKFSNTLLIIDDEDDIRFIVRELAELFFEEVYEAETGEAGLTILKEKNIDVVISDIKMPGMNGLETIALIKKLSPKTLCIFMTAYADKKNIIQALQLGAYDFLEKPFDAEYLKTLFTRCLELKNTKKLNDEIKELLLVNYGNISLDKYLKLPPVEKGKILEGVLGIMRLKMMNRQMQSKD